MNAQEFGPPARPRRGGERLRLKGGEQSLEPFKGAGILTDPDELDAAETAWRVGPGALVVNILEDRGPWRDADAGADEDGDFVVKDVFRGGTIGPVDADVWHGLAVLQRNFVHPHGIQGVIVFGLGGARTQSVAERPGEVTDLPDVNGDVVVKGAGGDGERMPLGGGDGGDVKEKPLPSFIPFHHAGFDKLNLQRVVRMTDHFGDLRRTAGVDFAVDALHQVDGTAPKFPAPAFIAKAVVPERRAGEGRVRERSVPYETSSGVSVEGKEERNKKVVGIPEGFVGLLADFGVGGGEHE